MTSEAKHTPWRVYAAGLGCVIVDRDDATVARVPFCDTHAETEARATLLAAAPALLAALQGIVAEIASQPQRVRWDLKVNVHALDAARAAIAQATGEKE